MNDSSHHDRTGSHEPVRSRSTSGRDRLRVGLSEALQIFGAIAGSAVLVYVVGATLMWLRFATTGFPADSALAAVPRERLVTLGLRSIGTWLLVVGLILLGVIAVTHLIARTDENSFARRVSARVLQRLSGPTGWVLALTAAVLSAFVTWSLLTLVVAAIASIAFARWYHRQADASRWLVAAFVAGLTAIVSVGWQLQINLPYDHAQFRLEGEPLGGTRDAIYFGTLDGAVYIVPREPEPSKAFIRGIAVVPQDQLANFRILEDDQTLCTLVPPPATAAWRGIERAFDAIEQHLRTTGQPDPEDPEPESDEPLPPGECPPQ
jgi:hypothetical protein